MHPFLEKILWSDSVILEDFENLQTVDREDVPELDDAKWKAAVLEKFRECTAKDSQIRRKLIKQGNRLLKSIATFEAKRPKPRGTNPQTHNTTPITETEPTIGISAIRPLVTMIETSPTTSSHTLSAVTAIPGMPSLENIEAVSVLDLNEGNDLLASIPLMNSVQGPSTTSGIIIMNQQSVHNAPVQPTAGPSTETMIGIDPDLIPLLDIVPPPRPPPTPREQELSELTLLPKRVNRKRKASTRPLLMEIPYSHYYPRRTNPDRLQEILNGPKPKPNPELHALVEALRAMLTVNEVNEEPQQVVATAIVPEGQLINSDGSSGVINEGVDQFRPVDVSGRVQVNSNETDPSMNSTIPARATMSNMEPPQIAPFERMTVSTPYRDPGENLIPEFADITNISGIPKTTDAESNKTPVGKSPRRRRATAGQSLEKLLAESMHFNEPISVKAQFLKALDDEVRRSRFIPIKNAIVNRSDAAWQFRMLLEFDGKLWDLQKDETSGHLVGIKLIN